MSKTAVIYDVTRSIEPKKPQGLVELALSVLEGGAERERIFQVVRPDGQESVNVYARQKESTWPGGQKYFADLDERQINNRNLTLQRIINELEGDGFQCNQAQLALFFSSKIAKLILSKGKVK